MSVEELARFMYERNASTYTEDPEAIAAVWASEPVRTFWLAEAQAVMDHLFGEGLF
jgi:hypothetical protein